MRSQAEPGNESLPQIRDNPGKIDEPVVGKTAAFQWSDIFDFWLNH